MEKHVTKRKLGLIAAIALVMGNMIGSGVFLLPSSLAPLGWNAVLAWIIVSAGTLVPAWVFAQLTRKLPEARDPAGFVSAAFGEPPAFYVSWAYWVSVWTAVVSIAVAAARVDNPEVNVPRATMWGTALTGALYLLVCSAVALMLPEAVASASPAPLSTFVERHWGSTPAMMVTVFAIISCVGAVNGWVLMQGELPRSMAQHGTLPAWLGSTDSRGTPARALIISSIIATICLVLNASRSMQGIYEFVLLLSTSAALWLYLAVTLAAWKLNVVRPFALVGAVYAIWTLWGAGIEASGWSLVLMLSGYPLYWLAKREGASAP